MTRANARQAGDRDEVWGALDEPNALPRSVIRRGQYSLLDGEWRFALDPDDRGLREGWFRGHRFAGVANWPGAIEGQLASARHAQEQDAQQRPRHVRPCDEPHAQLVDQPRREVSSSRPSSAIVPASRA